MRKFFIGVFAAVCVLIGAWYAVYYAGLYVDLDPDAPVAVYAKTEGKQLMVPNRDGVFEPFIVKGVELSSSLPGSYATDFAADEATYLRWMEQISQMGANTVWVTIIMDDEFYNALHAFNSAAAQPLYLLQGFRVSEYANNGAHDAYSSDFYQSLKQDAVDAVDVIHGRKNISIGRMRGSGVYRKDVSQWVLGYTVGLEWDPGIIAYTDREGRREAQYQGKYIKTTQNATAFEAMLAQVMDQMVRYETSKYKAQRLVSFVNDPQNDPFEYAPEYGRQIAKYNCMDAEHITAADALASGYFASYRMYTYCYDFADYFSQEQKEKLAHILPRLATGLYYQGYTQLLSEYHTMPVVVTGYGYSTARGLVNQLQTQHGSLSEAEQGEELVSTYNDIVTSGCSGAIISAWQDVWGRRTWNTSFSIDLTRAIRWHDLQSDGQGYGLLAFDPGKETRVCAMDGNPEEWTQADFVTQRDGVRLYAKYDEEGIYLMLAGDAVRADQPVYVPIDTTQKTGSKVCGAPTLVFARPADFVLCIDGTQNSRLLVQERSHAMRENYQQGISGDDPFVEIPAADSARFVIEQMAVEPYQRVVEDAGTEDRRHRGIYLAWDTGRLIHGNGNPAGADYQSRADFCFGDGCVEVRLPWQMLNFYDPSNLQVHDDYYLHYGVEPISVSSCWLGIAFAGTQGEAPMAEFQLNGWSKPQYHERLKQSYQIVQRAWR